MADSIGNQCALCGYKALVRHDGYLVCEECGTINNEDMITSENQDAVGYQAASENKWIMSDKKKMFKHSNDTRIPAGQTFAINQIRIYGNLLNFSRDMIEQAEQMFIDLFRDEEIINKYVETKTFIAYGCLFFVGRMSSHLISIKEFIRITTIPISKFVHVLKLIERKLSKTLPTSSITEITVEIAIRHNIHKDVRQTAISILSICDRAWLVTGRNPQKVAWSAIYIASKSQYLEDFQNITFQKFLKKHKVHYNSNDGDRFREVINVLTDLGNHIPWARNKGKRDFVYCNLADIIKYSRMALMEKKLKLMKMFEDEKDTNECSDRSHKRKIDNENQVDLDVYEPPALKYAKPSPITEDSSISTVYVDCEIDELGSKIDAELDEYIRTDAEVKEIEKARALIIEGDN